MKFGQTYNTLINSLCEKQVWRSFSAHESDDNAKIIVDKSTSDYLISHFCMVGVTKKTEDIIQYDFKWVGTRWLDKAGKTKNINFMFLVRD